MKPTFLKQTFWTHLKEWAFVTVVPANNVFGEGFDEIKVGLPRKKKNE